MTRAVQRQAPDGLTAMMRYGVVALVIGALALTLFLVFSMALDPPQHDEAAYMVGAGLLAQWVWFIVQFAPGYMTLNRESRAGWDQKRTSRLFVAGALGDAGWALLFAAAALGAIVTGSFAAFGVSTPAVLAASLTFILLPGAVVVLTLVVLSRRAQNAR